MGAAVPKQYLPLAGSRVIEHSLSALQRCEFIEAVVVVVSQDDDCAAKLACLQRPDVVMCHGGATRSASVLAGLEVLRGIARADDWVLVHDAARPCVSVADVSSLARRVSEQGVGGILAEQVVDTIKRVDGQGHIVETVARAHLWRAQTPQMFRLGALYEALALAIADDREVTDESSVMEGRGQPVLLVPGATANKKITVPEDLKMAELYLAQAVDNE